MQLHITGSRQPRPAAQHVIYCDGGLDADFRDGQDIELSHWIPNRTPAAFKASTTTEICIRYVERHDPAAYDLVLNNHVDTDGVLSTFVLCHPQLALAHRRVLVQAAEMGDFRGHGEPQALVLYQVLCDLKRALQGEGADPIDLYRAAHALTVRVLGGEAFPEAEVALTTVGRACEAVAHGQIQRSLHGERLALYRVPQHLAQAPDLLRIPAFDVPITADEVLPAIARARWDAEHMQLIASEHANGWAYDLWAPGYTWAETVGLWRPPGLVPAGSSNEHRLDHPPLTQAFAALNAADMGEGHWALARTLSPFSEVEGRRFPVIGAYLHKGQPALSQLAPEHVAEVLARVWV
jgi:hypothetical protein